MRDLARSCAAFVVAAALLGASAAPIVVPTAGDTWSTGAVAKLDGELDAMLANDPALRGAHYGIYAIDTATGMQLYAHGADDEVQPASTLKLLVGSAALEKLGPTFVYRSSLLASQAKTLFVLRAGGDPFLERADLQSAAHALGARANYAATEIVDDTRYDTTPYPDGWTWDDFGQSYAPRVSAIALDEDVVKISVRPGPRAGAAPLVDMGPDFDLRIVPRESSGATAEQSCDARWRSHVISMISSASTGAAGADDTVDARLTADGCPEIFGTIPFGGAVDEIDLAIPDVRGYVEGLLAEDVNRAAPTQVVRPIDRSMTPPSIADATDVVWSHDSAPLGTWLGPRFWIPSDNLVGEMLLRELGYATAGKPGTTENGIAYEKAWLQSIGVDPTTVTLADGCGMSQYDRITARDLVTILQHDWNGPNRQLVLDSLPVGGVRGTIEGIAGTAAAGRVFAKTGSMMHVRGLAGYLAPAHHGAVTFAFEVDDWNGAYRDLAALRARFLDRIVSDEADRTGFASLPGATVGVHRKGDL